MTNPGNIVRVRSRNGGHSSVYEANMWAQKWPQGLYSGNGVLQNTSPDMNVLIGGTPSSPDVVIGQNPSGFKIALDIIGQQAVQITAPASNSRISSIVAYTNDLSLQSTDDSTTGSPSSCGLIIVNGTAGASPTPPSDSQIRTAITADGATGSQAIYGIIANIPVASSTTNITNALISIQKSLIQTDTLAESAVTPGKRSGGFYIGVIPATTFGTTGNKSITGLGFKPKLVRFTALAALAADNANSGSGAMTPTSQYWTSEASNTSGAHVRNSGTDAAIAYLSSGSTIPLMKSSYVSMDSDGFTINVTAASAAFAIAYEANA